MRLFYHKPVPMATGRSYPPMPPDGSSRYRSDRIRPNGSCRWRISWADGTVQRGSSPVWTQASACGPAGCGWFFGWFILYPLSLLGVCPRAAFPCPADLKALCLTFTRQYPILKRYKIKLYRAAAAVFPSRFLYSVHRKGMRGHSVLIGWIKSVKKGRSVQINP